MKSRFFWSIFSVLLVVAVTTVGLHHLLLRKETLRLIDQQVRETASSRLTAKLAGLEDAEIDKVEDILADELGDNRIGKFFILHNEAGDTIYESASAKLLPVKFVPRKPQWVTLTGKGQFIRVLNLELPRVHDRTLQVGLVIDQDFIAPEDIVKNSFIIVFFIFAVGLSASWLLSGNLVRPITLLASFVERISNTDGYSLELPSMPPHLKPFLDKSGRNKNELKLLFNSFEKLIQSVNKGYKLSRFWSYQMAHELKTPLTVIETVVDSIQDKEEFKPEKRNLILSEVFKASEIITSFLSWAETENTARVQQMHVVRISRVLEPVEKRIANSFPHRLQLEIKDDFSVLVQLEHAEQIFTNLIVNAIKYSPPGELVRIETVNRTLKVIDKGEGVPKEVLERLGEPFNKGENAKKHGGGSGLGLAYVYSVCKAAGWILNVGDSPNPPGTQVEIIFPEV